MPAMTSIKLAVFLAAAALLLAAVPAVSAARSPYKVYPHPDAVCSHQHFAA